MLSIRIVTASAAAAIAFALAVGGASAQTAASNQAGKPLPLLAGLRPPPEIKAHAKKTSAKIAAAKHTKLASKRHNKIAVAQAEVPPAQPAPLAPPATVGPLADTAPPADIVTTASPETATSDTETTPSTVVVGGQTVQVTSPDQVNQIDLAANDDGVTAATRIDSSEKTQVMQTVLAAPAHEDASQNAGPISNASWFAQVLAALGGAFAAGTVAWFLIGSGPVRTYG